MTQADLTHQRLVRAALELFTTTGYHLTTTPLIAKKAGVAEGTIYRHFASKQHLLNELYRAAGRWAVRLVKEADALNVGPREKLAELGRGLVAGAGRAPAAPRPPPPPPHAPTARPPDRHSSSSETPTPSPAPQREQLDLRRREHPDRHADHADAATHVQLTVASLEVPHHVLRDQPARRPANPGQVELSAVDVPGQREGDAARRRRVPRARSVREQHLERVRRRRRKCGRDVFWLGVVRRPVVRVVDAEQLERCAAPLDQMTVVLQEHLPRVAAAADHLLLAGIAVVVSEHGHDAERRVQLAEGAHVRRDVSA